MTANQIAWSKAKEEVQHNRITESETARHNVATEVLESNKLIETTRHNKATEDVEQGKLGEQRRHNYATEAVEVGKLSEATRHNKVSESQGWTQLDETKRHNTVTEGIGLTQAQASTLQAQAAWSQARTAKKAQKVMKDHYAKQDWVNQSRLQNEQDMTKIQQQLADARDIELGLQEAKNEIEQQNANARMLDAIWSNTNGSLEAAGTLISKFPSLSSSPKAPSSGALPSFGRRGAFDHLIN